MKEMKEVADELKIKGYGRNNIFKLLYKNNILFNRNTPVNKYIRLGYFTVIKQTYMDVLGEYRETTKVLVTEKGVRLIKELILEDLAIAA